MALFARYMFLTLIAGRLTRVAKARQEPIFDSLSDRAKMVPIAVRLVAVVLLLIGQVLIGVLIGQVLVDQAIAAPKSTQNKAVASKAETSKAVASKPVASKSEASKTETSKPESPKSESSKASAQKASAKCPSQDFGRFMDSFADSPNVQRRFTRLPLEYGQVIEQVVAPVESGDPEQAREFALQTIEAFDKIPLFDRREGGRIFPSRSKRNREDLVILQERGMRENPEFPDERDSPDDDVVLMFTGSAGHGVYFRFSRSVNCWFLEAIHDKSAWSDEAPAAKNSAFRSN